MTRPWNLHGSGPDPEISFKKRGIPSKVLLIQNLSKNNSYGYHTVYYANQDTSESEKSQYYN